MKFTGFAATYASNGKSNKQNYFFNGIGKDDVTEAADAEFCDSSNRRNIFAVSDASSSLARGAEAAYICIDLLRDFVGSDFRKTNREYFIRANEIIKGRIFEENGKQVCADMGVLYLNRDCAYAYNIGKVPMFYYNAGGTMRSLHGEPPKMVDVETVTTDDSGEVVFKNISKKTIPCIGCMSEEYAVVPHISEKIRFADKDIFVILTQSVLNVLEKSAIKRVLADSGLDTEEKTYRILDMAVKANPEENYTVQLIEVKGGKKIGMFRISTAVAAAAMVLVIGIASVFGDTVRSHLNKANEGVQSFVVNIMSKLMNVKEDEKKADPWTPLRKEEPEKNEQPAKSEEPSTAPEQKSGKKDNGADNNGSAVKTKKTWSPRYKPTAEQNPMQEEPENITEDDAENKNTDIETPEAEILNNPSSEADDNADEESEESIIYGETIDVVIPPMTTENNASEALNGEVSEAE